jgi:alpha-D-xyloside xylohydrolase
VIFTLSWVNLKAQVVKTEDGIIIKNSGKNKNSLQIRVLSDNVIHVTNCSTGVCEINRCLATSEILKNAQFSLVIDNEYVILKTVSLHVFVDLRSRKVFFKDKNNNSLLTEGNRTYTNKVSSGGYGKVKQEFLWSQNEILHVIGHDLGIGAGLKGGDLLLSSENSGNYPLILSSKGYGIVWGDQGCAYFNDNETIGYILTKDTNQIDYYFLYGPSGEDVALNYCKLTGKVIEMPKLAENGFN